MGLMGLLGVLESLFCPVNCGSYWGFVCGLFGFLENMYGIFLRNFLKKNPILVDILVVPSNNCVANLYILY